MNNFKKKKTKIIGLIGHPISHSMSPTMHNLAFRKMQVDALYEAYDVTDLKKFVDFAKKAELSGFNVTIPHKTEIIRFLDVIDKPAKELGAINTVRIKKGKTYGYNTDWTGAIMALKEKGRDKNLKGKKVIVLGAGGASRALVYGLAKEKAEVTIINRTKEKAKAIAEDFGCRYDTQESFAKHDYDILINTTSVGMIPKSKESPVKKELLKEAKTVMDIVYNPLRTQLLIDAKEKMNTIIDGVEMLVNQGSDSMKIILGIEEPVKLMKKHVRKTLKSLH